MKMSFNYNATTVTYVETIDEAFVLTLMEAIKEAKNGGRVTGIQFASPEVAECATIWVDAPATHDIPYDGMIEFVSFHWTDKMEIWHYAGNGIFELEKTRKGPYFNSPITNTAKEAIEKALEKARERALATWSIRHTSEGQTDFYWATKEILELEEQLRELEDEPAEAPEAPEA